MSHNAWHDDGIETPGSGGGSGNTGSGVSSNINPVVTTGGYGFVVQDIGSGHQVYRFQLDANGDAIPGTGIPIGEIYASSGEASAALLGANYAQPPSQGGASEFQAPVPSGLAPPAPPAEPAPPTGLSETNLKEWAAGLADGTYRFTSPLAIDADGLPTDASLKSHFRQIIKEEQPNATARELEQWANDMLVAYRKEEKGTAAPKTAADYAAEYDAAIAEANAAIDAYGQSLGVRVFKTDDGQGFYYDEQGRQVPIGYSSQRGRVEAGQPVTGQRFTRGPDGTGFITNAPRAQRISQEAEQRGSFAVGPERAASLANAGIVEATRALAERDADGNITRLPTLAEINATLGSSVAGAPNPFMRLNAAVGSALPGFRATGGGIASTSGAAGAQARFEIAADRANIPPALRDDWVAIQMANWRQMGGGQGSIGPDGFQRDQVLTQGEQALFNTIDPSQYGQVLGSRADGRGGVNGIGTAVGDDGRGVFTKTVFGGNEAPGVGVVRPMSALEVQNAVTALSGSTTVSEQIADLSRNFTLGRGAEGFYITGPDGQRHGPFATIQDAESWQRQLAMQLFQSQQRDINARFGGNTFGGAPNAGLGPNPARPRVNTPDAGDRRPERPPMAPDPSGPTPPVLPPSPQFQQVSPTTFVGAPVYQQVPAPAAQVAQAFGGSNASMQSAAGAVAPVQSPAFASPKKRRRKGEEQSAYAVA